MLPLTDHDKGYLDGLLANKGIDAILAHLLALPTFSTIPHSLLTYNPDRYPATDYGDPSLPLYLDLSPSSLRIILGALPSSPDLFIERQPTRWAICIHNHGDSDALGCLYISDSDRSCRFEYETHRPSIDLGT